MADPAKDRRPHRDCDQEHARESPRQRPVPGRLFL